jgi:hypothetical protein
LSSIPSSPRFHNKESYSLAPISSIVEGFSSTEARTKFCYQVAQRALNSLLAYQYTDFDAQTTSNCCHGISLLARKLITQIQNQDLQELSQKVTQALTRSQLDPDLLLPKELIELSQMYVLNHIRVIDPEKGVRSSYHRLKELGNFGKSFNEPYMKNLQKKYSNLVADRYSSYVEESPDTVVNCLPLDIWGKYVKEPYSKTSKDTRYVSSLFSMQVCLGHLSKSRAKVALVNDIYDTSDTLRHKYICLFEGDGNGGFKRITELEESEPKESVVVFGGCSITPDPNSVIDDMGIWANRFPELVLAGESQYPQFPKVKNDPKFDSAPIIPQEDCLRDKIDQYRTMKGISARDPSLFCANHIFPSSYNQIRQASKGQKTLPEYKIPTGLLKNQV